MTEPESHNKAFVRDLLAQDEELNTTDFEGIRSNILDRVAMAKRREKLARRILLAFGSFACVLWLLLALTNAGLIGDTSRWSELAKQSAATTFFLLPVVFCILAGIYIFRHYCGLLKARSDARDMTLASIEAQILELRKSQTLTVPETNDSSNRPSGFSLLELLVVIGILGLLAALLVPALQSARNHASRMTCQSNLSQLSRAVVMYLGDHHVYPGTSVNPIRPVTPPAFTQSDQAGWLWDDFLAPYLPGIEKIMQCPVHTPSSYEMRSGAGYRANYNYGYNALGTGEPWVESLGLGMWLVLGRSPQGGVLTTKLLVPESEVRIPSEMVELGERQGGDAFCTPILAPGSQTASSENDPSNHHQGGSSVAFCDSHVEFATQQQWKTSSGIQRLRWNRDHLSHIAQGK